MYKSPYDGLVTGSWSAHARRQSRSQAGGWRAAAQSGRPPHAKARWP